MKNSASIDSEMLKVVWEMKDSVYQKTKEMSAEEYFEFIANNSLSKQVAALKDHDLANLSQETKVHPN